MRGLYVPVLMLALLAGAASACGPQTPETAGEEEDERGEASMPQKSIQEVLADHTDRLMSIPGVVGVGQGECDGEPCVSVMVKEDTEEIRRSIPSELDGYRVRVRETGEFRALDPP